MDSGEIVKTGITALKYSAAAGASIPFTALARRMLGPAADEVAQMLTDQIRVYRYQRQLKLLQKAEAMAIEAGFTPERVSLKLLFPLLEGASLEENEDLHTMWAALLANASHPSSISLVLPSFPEVLRVITPDEARLLDAAYRFAISRVSPTKRTPSSALGIMDPEDTSAANLNAQDASSKDWQDHLKQIEQMKELTQVDLGSYRDLFDLFLTSTGSPERDLLITSDADRTTLARDLELRYQFDVAFEELERLQMWTVERGKNREQFYLSSFGCQFITVCNAPKSVETKR